MEAAILNQVDSWYRVRSALISRIEKFDAYLSTLEGRQSSTARTEIQKMKWDLRLVNNPTSRTLTYTQFVKKYGKSKEHVEKHFGFEMHPRRLGKAAAKFMDLLREATKQSRVTELRTRLNDELETAYRRNEYVVFDTLTCEDKYVDRVFKPKSQAWNTYIKNWKRKAQRHRYFAVVERGDTTGRLHIHVVHLFAEYEGGLTDPNTGSLYPTNREIPKLKKHWNKGISAPIAVRFEGLDRWAQEGWRWPMQEGEAGLEPVHAKPPAALANYVSKYIVDGYRKETERWRTKISQKFGINKATMMCKALTTKALRAIIGNMIPSQAKNLATHRTLKIVATREYLMRLIYQGKNVNRLLKSVRKKPSIMTLLDHMIHQPEDHKNSRFCPIKSRFLNADIFDEISLACRNVIEIHDTSSHKLGGNTFR